MFGVNFSRQRPGRPIAARTLNRPADSAERQGRFRVGRGLVQQLVGGIPLVRSTRRSPRWVRVTGAPTGSPPRHPWQGVYDIPGGTWGDFSSLVSDRSMADPLYEANGRTIPVGEVVEAWRGECSGELRCQMDNCA